MIQLLPVSIQASIIDPDPPQSDKTQLPKEKQVPGKVQDAMIHPGALMGFSLGFNGKEDPGTRTHHA